MDNTTYIALSRQAALWNQLEVVANNLANTATTNKVFLVESVVGAAADKKLVGSFVQKTA